MPYALMLVTQTSSAQCVTKSRCASCQSLQQDPARFTVAMAGCTHLQTSLCGELLQAMLCVGHAARLHGNGDAVGVLATIVQPVCGAVAPNLLNDLGPNLRTDCC